MRQFIAEHVSSAEHLETLVLLHQSPEQEMDAAAVSRAIYTVPASACAVLLLRAYAGNRVRLLFWSGLCFSGLALNNVLLFIDLRVVPETDLSVWRSIPALFGVAALLYGLVWET